MRKERKYYIIKNRNMMITLSHITGQKPFEYEDNNDKTKKVWSFINDENFKEAMTVVNELMNKYRR